MMDILAGFYNPKDGRDYVKSPFNLDGKTMATDSKIFVTAPEIKCYRSGEELGIATSARKLLEENKPGEFSDFKPPRAILGRLCQNCAGIGKLLVQSCMECDDEGSIYFSTRFNDYEVTCESCWGRGRQERPDPNGNEICSKCSGTGIIYSAVDICGMKIKQKYIHAISKLTDVQISQNFDKHMLFFKSAEGVEGIVMEYRDCA